MHFTPATVAVGLALARAPEVEHWGYALAKSVDVAVPTVNAVLHRMLDAGWLTVRVEPPRRLYRVTAAGQAGLERLRQAAGKPPPTAGPFSRGTRSHRPSTPRQTGTCPECRTSHVLRDDGWLPGHRRSGRPCPGSWEDPVGVPVTVPGGRSSPP